MKISPALLGLSLWLTLAPPSARAQEPETAPAQEELVLEEGFVRLDNGKDLAGWLGDTTGWSVKDGAIHLDAAAAKGNLFSSVRHSRSVIIRLQFRAEKGADSGVFLFGRQLQVRDYSNAGPEKYAFAAKPAGEWNDLEFDVTDRVAVVTLNGQVIEKAWKIGLRKRKGFGLQREKGSFEFRFIRIKEK